MFQKLSTSYNLVKVSFMYIKRDGELLMYSLFSLIASIAILITFFGVDYFFIGFFDSISNGSQSGQEIPEFLVYAIIFVYYLVFSFITFFFNTAIISSVQRRNEGKDNKFGDGLKDAMAHLKEIFIWSLINALVSTILKLLQNKFGENSIVGKVIIGIVGGVRSILTFFSFPLMILNGLGPKDAIKESGNLFKKTWGERAIIHVGIGLLFFFLYLAVIGLGVLLVISGLYVSGIIITFILIILLAILGSTCDVIIKTILLHYATTGDLPSGLEDNKSIISIAGER